jgi:hypothetical protein
VRSWILANSGPEASCDFVPPPADAGADAYFVDFSDGGDSQQGEKGAIGACGCQSSRSSSWIAMIAAMLWLFWRRRQATLIE